MEIRIKGVVVDIAKGKTGYTRVGIADTSDTGGMLRLTFQPDQEVALNRGQFVDGVLSVAGQDGKFGYSLNLVQGTFGKPKAA